MNLIVVRKDGSWYTRPDTTMEREMKDFYLPDDCSGVIAINCTFIKFLKAGKAIRPKFALRYFDSFGEGILLYGIAPDGNETPYIDGSSYLWPELRPVSEMDKEQLDTFINKLESITRHISVRIGDILALEIGDPAHLERGGTINNISIR